jgi:ABC-2 type transport system ATP-binding protein
MTLLSVKALSKSYNRKIVVDNVSFEINEGEIFGLLGENGAGKTTTIKMITTLSRADFGQVFIDEVNVFREKRRARELMAVVPQEINLDDDISVYDNLLVYAKLRKVKNSKVKIDKVINDFGLSEKRNEKVMSLSGGQKRRVMIARVMLTDAKLIFMDEPTIGLDPGIRRDIWQIIHDMKASGRSVLLTTHYTDEAENLCDRVAIMRKGEIISIDSPENLVKSAGSFALDIIRDNKFITKLFRSEKEIEEYKANEKVSSCKVRLSRLEDVLIKTGEIS